MSWQPRSRTGWWILGGIALVLLAFGQQIWKWEVERVDVEPGKFLVVINRWGEDLPEDEIIATQPGYKGIQLEVLPEGRHFLNPLFYAYEVHPIVEVLPGKCLVVTRKFGKRLPPGSILANDDERGIVPKVYEPGKHRINPYAYDKKEVEAVTIKAGEVGVKILKLGKDPRELPPDPKRSAYVVPDGYRGIQQTPAKDSNYYINPFVETIVPVEIRSHRVELTDIEFPSRDGFTLKPRVVVEYALMPERAPEALVRLTDDGVLHQDDDTPEKIARNPILQKVILPQVRGFVRLEGSNYSAKDFIIVDSEKQGTATVNYRKKLQDALLAKVKPRCAELGIEVRAINLAQMELPQDLREQIALRDTARQELEKNKALIGKFKQEQQYAATKAKEKRSELEVSAKTRLIEATQLAEQKKAVLQAQLKQELESAQIKLDAARNTAKAILAAAQSEADVINAKNKAEVAGLRTSVQGLGGAAAFAQYHVVQRLAPALQEIFAGDDSDFAKLVAGYLMPAPPKSAGATAGNGTGPAPTVPTASGNGK